MAAAPLFTKTVNGNQTTYTGINAEAGTTYVVTNDPNNLDLHIITPNTQEGGVHDYTSALTCLDALT